MLAAVFADEQGAHLFGELEVVRVGDVVGVGGVAQGVGGDVLTGQQHLGVHGHPFAVDGAAGGVLLATLEVQRHHGAGHQLLGHRDAVARHVGGIACHHGRLDVLQRRVGNLVLGVDRGAFHLGEAQAGAEVGGVAVGFQEGSGLFHARVQLDPLGLAVGHDLGVAGIGRVGGLHGHDVRGLERVGQVLDLGAGGRAHLDPGEGRRRAHLGVDGEAAAHLGNVQRAGRQVFLLVGHKHKVAAVGRVVAHQRGAVVRHHLHQLVRDAAHAEVLLDAGSAVGVHRHFGHVAVVVRVGLGFVAVQVLAVGLEHGVAGDAECVGLVLFARQVGAPRR